jgi:hypothetical protein
MYVCLGMPLLLMSSLDILFSHRHASEACKTSNEAGYHVSADQGKNKGEDR